MNPGCGHDNGAPLPGPIRLKTEKRAVPGTSDGTDNVSELLLGATDNKLIQAHTKAKADHHNPSSPDAA
jgi:hypothetical protein